jgi:leucyl-tRNA synthetase
MPPDMTPDVTPEASPSRIPPFRYNAELASEIEARWQATWERDHTFDAPNPVGPMSEGFDAAKRKLYVLDMFPYPSGAGLHVGHPLGYIGTDVYARYQRMNGANVLHAMGYDAFGLPAEQYAVQTGQHPRVTTDANIANMRRQLRALGLGHDPRRSIATTDVNYYRWTQWIFLQIFNSWYDEDENRARPIAELETQFARGERVTPTGADWATLKLEERADVLDGYRLAYLDDAMVNWCPGLGTVLANEEVTADGRSERDNFPVYRRPMKQWKMRITAYADRLLADLDLLDWTDSIKLMQRNWIGRSVGADVTFTVADNAVTTEGEGHEITVFTTRPDTLFGATYMVLAPEHPLVDSIVPNEWPVPTGDVNADAAWRGVFGADVTPPEAILKYRTFAGTKSELERQADTKDKTGVFTGAFAINPTNNERIPIFIADYVLMGYGTGAIMAVPAHDQRDFAFAQAYEIPIVKVIEPSAGWYAAHGVDAATPAAAWPEAFADADGVAVNSANEVVSLDGRSKADAIATINAWLESIGRGRATVTYKLRDWLFSRQRYWGEPFPILYDELGRAVAVPESHLPVELPEVDDFAPRTSDDPDALPAPPLARATDWVNVTLDLGDGRGPRRFTRETNTMPQWAGSCWYYLRYLDPQNDTVFVDPAVEQYWMDGQGVDLYVGGVEHAVLHLLYARFWHKVLYDLGHVSSLEPFHRLYNQGYIQAFAYTDARGVYVDAASVVARDGGFFLGDEPVNQEYGKMGKSLKNAVTPDDMYIEYGADTLRLYEMFMGPLDASRPWSTTDVVGVHRFLQRLWRNLVDETTGESRVTDAPADDETRRVLHRTIAALAADMPRLSFNTSIARLFELNNQLTRVVERDGAAPREVAHAITLMLAPLAPHVAEELWARQGHATTITYESFPVADESLLVADTIEIPVQINGKVRSKVVVAADATPDAIEAAALGDEKVVAALAGRLPTKVVVVPGRTVSIVVKG